MTEPFELPVIYINELLHFTSRLLVYGYTHKIQVDVNGIELLFEPDEERNYRAILVSSDVQNTHKIDKELVKAIAEAITLIVGK
jgi:hypothetical protein